MKIKLDENLPFRLVTLLKDLGHDAHTVHEERLQHYAVTEDSSASENRFIGQSLLYPRGPRSGPSYSVSAIITY
jgi:hypothetical protein